jgi:hypothetical protein
MTESKYRVAKKLEPLCTFYLKNFFGFEALTFQPGSLRRKEEILQLGHRSTGMQSAFVSPKAV